MDPDVISFAVVAVVIVVMAGALSGILVLMTRALKAKPSAERPTPLYEQRLDQLQQSVDAIAVEVERIAEAQRFSAKLLAERAETPALQR
jgi:hypothetical protein